MTDVAIRDPMTALEAAVVGGDLSHLTPEQRMVLYVKRCESAGLSPFSQPFDYIVLDGKLTLYANKGCFEQLRRIHKINARIVSTDELHDCYRVVVEVTEMETGRAIVSTGLVPLVKENGAWKTASSGKRYLEKDGTTSPLAPADFCNAVMKAESKAYRRATNALLGLGMLDETELDTIPDARPVTVNTATGEIVEPKPTNGTAHPESAPIVAAQTRSPYVCKDCGKQITSVRTKAGKDYSGKDIAEKAIEQVHRQLCYQCLSQAMDEKRAAAASLPPMADDDEPEPIEA